MECNGVTFKAWCRVRTMANGKRKKNQVEYSIPDHEPYDPAEIPLGTWEVFCPEARQSEYLAPYFIPTSAAQELKIWEIKNGEYVKPTDHLTVDSGYGIHYSTSDTTLGCIRIEKKADLLWLVNQVSAEIRAKKQVFLEVTK